MMLNTSTVLLKRSINAKADINAPVFPARRYASAVSATAMCLLVCLYVRISVTSRSSVKTSVTERMYTSIENVRLDLHYGRPPQQLLRSCNVAQVTVSSALITLLYDAFAILSMLMTLHIYN